MIRAGGWLFSVASLLSLIQSAVWMVLSLASLLVYLCVIPVPPYKSSGDFIPVTMVKLYFEGPECIPDGSYLGQFNKDYRNPEVLRLFTPDKVFALMVAYFILNGGHFVMSIKCWMNRKSASAAVAPWQNDLFLRWSAMTLIICAIDAFFTAELICDVISLSDYMGDKRENAEVYVSFATRNTGEIPYIPLLLALISSRFIGLWLWNFIVGMLFFFRALCCRRSVQHLHKIAKEDSHITEEVQPPIREHSSQKNLSNGNYISAYDIRSHPDFSDLRKSSEAVTRFSSSTPKTVYPENKWSYTADEGCWQSSKPNTSKDTWEMTNEGYVSDEQVEPEKSPDFDHDLKNFEQGQRKIKIVKSPKGKPVSIPIPPPLPTSGSCRGEDRVRWQKKNSQRESRCYEETNKR